MKFDFSGWATRNDLECYDGRTIRKDAFKDDDGQIRPLVWNHQHNSPDNVLGHALLENREDGVYAYCSFNETEQGENAKKLVEHGDICALSIYANHLKQRGGDVLHGAIREVSLVLSGANPGAFIDSVMSHGEVSDDEVVFYTLGNYPISLHHADKDSDDEKEEEKEEDKSDGDETVQDVFDTLNEKQKNVVYAMLAEVAAGSVSHSDDDSEDEEEEEDEDSEEEDVVNDNSENNEPANKKSRGK